MSTTIDCAHANYSSCSTMGPEDVGLDSPAGDGKWGQSDLAGNVGEWMLDSYAQYVTPCTDCANVEPPLGSRVIRSGSYGIVGSALISSYRSMGPIRDGSVGVRCVRAP